MEFTIEEINLMCIYDCRSRKNLINELEESILYTDDNEIIQLIESATDKLYKMNDQEFSELTLVPAWEDEEDYDE